MDINKLVAGIRGFARREAVLCAALLLAVASAFFVPPDGGYAEYIDYNTLLLLFALMAAMAGLRAQGVFTRLGGALLKKTGSTRGMLLTLTMAPFITSMLITNDVALITFVPFGITVLRMAAREKYALPLAVLQTLAANLGSMLTPMGNPQNLYLYARSGMGAGEFMLLTLPYAALSGLVIALFVVLCTRRDKSCAAQAPAEGTYGSDGKGNIVLCVCYAALFALCVLSVAKLVPAWVCAAAALVFMLAFDRGILARVDYPLLLTFVGFFIFIGNMGRLEAFRAFLTGVIEGREAVVAVLSSQLISNVPAALLLAGFTRNWPALIIGTNIGGLGTLIASMASLISYKQF